MRMVISLGWLSKVSLNRKLKAYYWGHKYKCTHHMLIKYCTTRATTATSFLRNDSHRILVNDSYVHSGILILTETFAENISCSFSKVRKRWWNWHTVQLQPKSNDMKFNSRSRVWKHNKITSDFRKQLWTTNLLPDAFWVKWRSKLHAPAGINWLTLMHSTAITPHKQYSH